MDAVSAGHDGNIQMIDSTSLCAHHKPRRQKEGRKFIVSVGREAASRPRSTSSSTRKASRSGSA